MSKVVFNNRFGSFSISEEAILLYAKIKGLSLFKEKDQYGFEHFYQILEGKKEYFSDCDFSRTDSTLIKVVEKLGRKANGSHAELKIAEIPSGSKYRIDEYDGNEAVMTPEDYEWSVAP